MVRHPEKPKTCRIYVGTSTKNGSPNAQIWPEGPSRRRPAVEVEAVQWAPLGPIMYQKSILPYSILLFPTYSPQADSLLERSRQTDFNTPFTLTSFFFHWARGALPAGATLLGWPNYGVDGRLNEKSVEHQHNSPHKQYHHGDPFAPPTALIQ